MDHHRAERQILAWDYILASRGNCDLSDIEDIETTLDFNLECILLQAGELKCYSLVDALLATFEKMELTSFNAFMHYAARDNDVTMIKILIKYGYEINSIFPKQTPFVEVNDMNTMGAIITLLNKGAQQTPLFAAISNNALHAVITLVENGAQLDNTLLKLALSCHNTKIAAYLYEQLIRIGVTHPLSIEEQTHYLSHAMQRPYNDSLIRFLISIRTERFEEKQINELLSQAMTHRIYNFIALFEALEEKGEKPPAALLLHEAIQTDKQDVIKYLLYRGEVVNVADWEFAQKKGDQDLLSLLRECSKVAVLEMEEPSHITPSIGLRLSISSD
jgi:ankyrin repeat protein